MKATLRSCLVPIMAALGLLIYTFPTKSFAAVPDFKRDVVLYEVNVRQFTKEGTLKAVEPHLSRIKNLGANVLWLMPIHPIGKVKRKGTLGSPYSITDYKAIHPSLGSLEDLKSLVRKAHQLGLYVILDWVGNHSAWDHPLVKKRPGWYRQERGQIIHPPGTDWTDVAAFDYSNGDLRKYMMEAMEFWVREVGIDGYRCDVAWGIPKDFWRQAIPTLNTIKPVFMLAEAGDPGLLDIGFDAVYGFNYHKITSSIANGKLPAHELAYYFVINKHSIAKGKAVLLYTSNHDLNSWEGPAAIRFGPALKTFATLSMTLPGIPLILGGQESNIRQQLAFFEKDQVNWGNYSHRRFYQQLTSMRKRNSALWYGQESGEFQQIKVKDDNLFAFIRSNDRNQILAIFNFSNQRRKFNAEKVEAGYKDAFTDEVVTIKTSLELEPWGYRILAKSR